MDDYSVASLQDSRNEWCSRLLNILTPVVIQGFKSIYDEAWALCKENDETEKYLMTFQNFLGRVPKWNATIIDEECKRITETSNCGYLNDLISCVHIIQLKSLTCMRVGNKQKKIDIAVPELKDFIHKVYINCARKIYTNIYLFEKNISPLQIQKHNRELELIVREQILYSIRENIPVEDILKVYLDETIEDDVEVIEREEIVSTEPIEEKEDEINGGNGNENKNDEENNSTNKEKETGIKFNDTDQAISVDKVISDISAPKDIERLEEISQMRHEERLLDEEDDDDDNDKLKIGEKIDLSELDVHNLDKEMKMNKAPIGLEEIEILT